MLANTAIKPSSIAIAGQPPGGRVGVSPAGAAMLAALVMLMPGCARRAYNDVYVENMSAEIRDLEDQLYEYDGEYRLMEQQLKALKADNARLRASLPPQSQGFAKPGSSASAETESFLPRGSTGSNASPHAAGKNLPVAPSPKGPSLAPSLDISPADRPPAAKNQSPPPQQSSGDLPQLQPVPKSVPGSDADDSLELKDLAPPTIEQGEPMPPLLPPPKRDPSNPLTLHSDHALEVELGRVVVPAQLAAGKSGLALPSDAAASQAVSGPSQSGGSASDESFDQARVHPPAETPSDTRIAELKFHPALCKAVNTDQQGDDDGLYLVLQPLNEQGQFVPLPADLMVIALDLSRDEKQATIGRWTLSSHEVKSKLQPIGSSQGIHLSLPFSGAAPQCDRLLVFAYYTLSDGRRIVAEKEILLHNLHRQNTVWVPRSKQTSAVRTASAAGPAK